MIVIVIMTMTMVIINNYNNNKDTNTINDDNNNNRSHALSPINNTCLFSFLYSWKDEGPPLPCATKQDIWNNICLIIGTIKMVMFYVHTYFLIPVLNKNPNKSNLFSQHRINNIINIICVTENTSRYWFSSAWRIWAIDYGASYNVFWLENVYVVPFPHIFLTYWKGIGSTFAGVHHLFSFLRNIDPNQQLPPELLQRW